MPTVPCSHCHMPVALYSTAEAAAQLGIGVITLGEKARARGIGTKIDARTWIYTDQDIAALAIDYRRTRAQVTHSPVDNCYRAR